MDLSVGVLPPYGMQLGSVVLRLLIRHVTEAAVAVAVAAMHGIAPLTCLRVRLVDKGALIRKGYHSFASS